MVALTAHAMRGERQHFLESEFDSDVAKPIIDEQELLATIAAMLNQLPAAALWCMAKASSKPATSFELQPPTAV